ncbi:MAG: hypothetical protein ACR2GN_00170 [Bacteroidia bacterium]
MSNGHKQVRPYREVQKFTSRILWFFLILLLLLFIGIIAFTIYNDYISSNNSGRSTFISDYLIMILSLLIIIGITYLFSIMKLEIIIDDKHLFFEYKPFLKRKFPLIDIIGFAERKFRPLIEFRGWGIRYSLFGHGMAYTIKGNTGVQFLTRSGKKFLLGTQKPGEIIYYLNKFINSDKDNDNS